MHRQIACQSLVERRDAKVGIHGIRQSPGQNLARCPQRKSTPRSTPNVLTTDRRATIYFSPGTNLPTQCLFSAFLSDLLLVELPNACLRKRFNKQNLVWNFVFRNHSSGGRSFQIRLDLRTVEIVACLGVPDDERQRPLAPLNFPVMGVITRGYVDRRPRTTAEGQMPPVARSVRCASARSRCRIPNSRPADMLVPFLLSPRAFGFGAQFKQPEQNLVTLRGQIVDRARAHFGMDAVNQLLLELRGQFR